MSKESGTRSSLLWQVERILRECKELESMPQILILENVTQAHGKKFLKDWNSWLLTLEELGYKNFWQDLNAKYYGTAQNRDRVFLVSILDKDAEYTFPEKIPLTTCLKDYLEDEVDEKFYLKTPKARALIEKLIERGGLEDLPTEKPLGNLTPADNDKIHQRNFVFNQYGIAPTETATQFKDPFRVMVEIKRLGNIYGENRGQSFAGNVYSKEGLCPAIMTSQGGNRQPLVIDKNPLAVIGSLQAHATIGDGSISPTLPAAMGMGGGHTPMVVQEKIICASRGRNVEDPSDRRAGIELEQRLEANHEGLCNTLTSVQKDNYVLEGTVIDNQRNPDDYAIRKITPLEAFRLMNFTDEEFHRAEAVVSNSALYKSSGNSIVVNVLVAIIGQMIEGREDYYKCGLVDNPVNLVDKITERT